MRALQAVSHVTVPRTPRVGTVSVSFSFSQPVAQSCAAQWSAPLSGRAGTFMCSESDRAEGWVARKCSGGATRELCLYDILSPAHSIQTAAPDSQLGIFRYTGLWCRLFYDHRTVPELAITSILQGCRFPVRVNSSPTVDCRMPAAISGQPFIHVRPQAFHGPSACGRLRAPLLSIA